MNLLQVVTASLSVSAILLLNGCSALNPQPKGAQFTEFKKPQENQGTVYVYRQSSWMTGIASYDIDVSSSVVRNFRVRTLSNGGYIELDLPVGESKILGEASNMSGVLRGDSVTLDIKNGEVYCLEGSIGIAYPKHYTKLEIVDIAKCKSEIIATRRDK